MVSLGGSTAQWYNDLDAVRKLVLQDTFCPGCHRQFDSGKKRRLVDTCGHELCFSCVYSNGRCPLCPPPGGGGRQTAQDPCSRVNRPKLKTNGHFTTFMQVRGDGPRAAPGPTFHGKASPVSPVVPRRSWKPGFESHTTSPLLSSSEYGEMEGEDGGAERGLEMEEEEDIHQHPSPRHDRYRPMRLGLLLGNGASEPSSTPPTTRLRPHCYASLSSLTSSEATNTTNTSPLSTLTSSSDVAKRVSSREDSADSVTSLLTASTGSSSHFRRLGPLRCSDSYVPSARRSQEFHPEEGTDLRRTLSPSGISDCPGGISDCPGGISDCPGGRQRPLKLKPLHFEVPNVETFTTFIGRQWLFKQIDKEVNSLSSHGVCIVGGPGTGKTAVLLQLVDNSAFARHHHEYQEVDSVISEEPLYQSLSSISGSCSQELARILGSRLAGYHFCQADNTPTCLVPDFVHSLAAQLVQSSQLTLYRDLLSREPRFQELLSISSCVKDPSGVFLKAVLEPLRRLRKAANLYIVIDALNEAELHAPDYGDTLSSFLVKHLPAFPSWLKIIVTVRSSYKEVIKSLPLHLIDLDDVNGNDQIQHDLYSYINFRVQSSRSIRNNITITGPNTEGSSLSRFSSHLAGLSKGSMLYVRSTLDLVEKGFLIVKSSSFRVLPVNLSEVYQLMFNLRFTTNSAFEKVRPILQVCLASPCPLTIPEIYYTVRSGQVEPSPTGGQAWEEFLHSVGILTGANFLVTRQDGSLTFPHPSLREWLLRREPPADAKFLCDIRAGHAMIALRMSRWEYPLPADRLLDLGHHVLKAHIYKTVNRESLPAAPPDLQAFWIQHSTSNISPALATLRNIYSPNVLVSKLLLLAGADPNFRTNINDNSPLLVMAATLGHEDMVTTLLEFGADVNAASDSGLTALSAACLQGHVEIAHRLLAWGAKMNQPDATGHCPLVYAVRGGSLPAVALMVQNPWPADGPRLSQVAQQALVLAAAHGHEQICHYLLETLDVRVNSLDSELGHTALTAACLSGNARLCEALLSRGASLSSLNDQGDSGMICAALNGHWTIVELFLNRGTDTDQRDREGKTALMAASIGNFPALIDQLIARGADLNSVDYEGRTAVSWASWKGNTESLQCLLGHGALVNGPDHQGRVPLDYGALSGDLETVKILLDNGAIIEHVDLAGMRPLDRAISISSVPIIILLLNQGATIGSQTWTEAEGNLEIIHLLLKKLLDDGIQLYKKSRLKVAAQRFSYALKKFPPGDPEGFHPLKFAFLVNLARCKRKLGDPEGAIEAADQAVLINPQSYEGYFQRARASKETGRGDEALKDIAEALRFATPSSEVARSLLQLKEEILTPPTLESHNSSGLSVKSGSPEGLEQRPNVLSLAPNHQDSVI